MLAYKKNQLFNELNWKKYNWILTDHLLLLMHLVIDDGKHCQNLISIVLLSVDIQFLILRTHYEMSWWTWRTLKWRKRLRNLISYAHFWRFYYWRCVSIICANVCANFLCIGSTGSDVRLTLFTTYWISYMSI